MSERLETAAVSGVDWRELEAGRDLDVAVLVRVFGFPRRKVFQGEWDTTEPYYIPSGKSRRTHMIDARPVPHFSTDMAMAWAVAVRMREDGFRVYLDMGDGIEAMVERDRAFFVTAADTAPLAICRAALQACAALPPKGEVEKSSSASTP